MSVSRFLALVAGALAAVQIVSPAVEAQVEVKADEDGTIVQIGPDRAESRRERRQQRRQITQPGFVDPAPVAVSRYWIGVVGGTVPPELRAQVDVPEEQGILVRSVSEGSPAAEAGLQPFDILLTANEKPLTNMAELAELVGEQGEKEGRLTLGLIRRGQPKTLWVKPIERPADAIAAPPRPRGRFGLFGPDGRFGNGQGLEGLDLEGLMNGGGLQLGEDGFGGFGEMIPQIASGGVSVSVAKQGPGPAKVTVKQGEKTWEFDEGDEDALQALPEDVRPMVERMLNQGGVAEGDLDAFGFDGPGFQLQFGGDLAERVRQMQQRMRALQGGAGAPANGPAILEPQIELDEAPAFNAEPTPAPTEEVEEAEPIEIEIPAEG